MLTDSRRRAAAGYSLVELLIVLAVLGIASAIGGTVWLKAREQSECTQAARIINRSS